MKQPMKPEYTKDNRVKEPRPKLTFGIIVAGTAVAALILGASGGFVAGLQAGKNTGTTPGQMSGPGGMDGSGMMGRRGMGNIGTVTAVSSSSITVKDQMQDDTTTYVITSDTTVTDDDESAAVSDIKVGDTVMVRAASSDSSDKTAGTIRLNPSFGGPGGMNGQTQSSVAPTEDDSSSSI